MKVTSSTKAFFEVVDVLIERFSWGVTAVVLRSVRTSPTDVKDSLVVKSLAFVNSCIQNVNLFIRYFSHKFNCRVIPVWKSNEFSNLLPRSHPQ